MPSRWDSERGLISKCYLKYRPYRTPTISSYADAFQNTVQLGLVKRVFSQPLKWIHPILWLTASLHVG